MTQQGGTLEFDCAQGTISEPLVLDAVGRFRAKGTFQTGGGPVRRDQKPGRDVVYTGTVEGDTMQLELTLTEDKGSPEKFTLVHGQPGNLRIALQTQGPLYGVWC